MSLRTVLVLTLFFWVFVIAAAIKHWPKQKITCTQIESTNQTLQD